MRAATDADGMVLLDLRSGRYLALNPLGDAVIQGLLRGQALDDVAQEVSCNFEVPPERVTADIGRFVEGMRDQGILEPGAATRAPAIDHNAGGAGASPASGLDAESALPAAPSLATRLGAYAVLLMVTLGMKVLGFGRWYRVLGWLPPSAGRGDPARARVLAAAIEQAGALLPRRAWCLERSLAAVILMRLRRWPARLVLGVKRMPFGAHAWVELEGQVVNDDPRVRRHYTVIESC